MKKILIIGIGLAVGLGVGYFGFYIRSYSATRDTISLLKPQKEVIGFLPYWLTSKARKDYSEYITTLTYFGLTIDGSGSIVKLLNEQESEPGWYTLNSGKMNNHFAEAKKQNIKLSLLIFSGDDDDIGELISDSASHAKQLIDEVAPIMEKYGFTDLNLDIESVSIETSEAQAQFTGFVKEVRTLMNAKKLGTLTIEASPTVLIKPYLIDAKEVAPYVDQFVFMTYDFHYPGSFVTGPVAPLGGGGTIAEFDTEQGIKEALKIMPVEKIILGLPLYGYEWETLTNAPRSAVIPGTGITASSRRVEEFLEKCATCSAQLDDVAKESYVIYKDLDTDTFHQIFYPDISATREKLKFANDHNLAGVALWALGYEDSTILEPLKEYR